MLSLGERSVRDRSRWYQQRRIGLSLLVAVMITVALLQITAQLLWCVAWAQVSRCLLPVSLAILLNQIMEFERHGGLDVMMASTYRSHVVLKPRCVSFM